VTSSSEEPEAPSRAGSIQVIARAGEMLRVLHDAPEGMTLAELSRRVDLPRSTVHRISAALEAEGFVQSGRLNGRLELGPELARLATTTSSKVVSVVHPLMQQLAADVEETIDLAVLSQGQVRFVDQVSGSQRLRAVSVVGALYPAHCTANGKVLLAALPNDTVTRLLPARLARHTEKTIVSRADLLKHLDEVRSAGIGFDLEEHDVRICAAAVPLHDTLGVVAALTLAAPSERFYARRDELVQALRAAARRANDALGAG
jgi:DNA-binding IclR family transcriptional regulator